MSNTYIEKASPVREEEIEKAITDFKVFCRATNKKATPAVLAEFMVHTFHMVAKGDGTQFLVTLAYDLPSIADIAVDVHNMAVTTKFAKEAALNSLDDYLNDPLIEDAVDALAAFPFNNDDIPF